MPALTGHDQRPVPDLHPATAYLLVNQNRRPVANCHTLPLALPSYQSGVPRESLHCMVKGRSADQDAHTRVPILLATDVDPVQPDRSAAGMATWIADSSILIQRRRPSWDARTRVIADWRRVAPFSHLFVIGFRRELSITWPTTVGTLGYEVRPAWNP